ncbi:MAG: hypothetical protein JW384_00674 [Nitrosomonadaceae bacterium]|nr:hypothetical protein [Nitrosomonadaceae bacterium]
MVSWISYLQLQALPKVLIPRQELLLLVRQRWDWMYPWRLIQPIRCLAVLGGERAMKDGASLFALNTSERSGARGLTKVAK